MAIPNISRKCALLELPPELRNRIYEHALIEDKSIDLFSWGRSGVQNTPLGVIACASEPALLRTCIEIRNDGLPIYYGRNLFDDLCQDKLECWKEFVHRVHKLNPKKVALIKCIRMHGAPPDYELRFCWCLSDVTDAGRAITTARRAVVAEGILLEKGAFYARAGSVYRSTDSAERLRHEYRWVREPVDQEVEDITEGIVDTASRCLCAKERI